MNDNFKQISKYLKKVTDTADFSLKRSMKVEPSFERIRDVFDADNPVRAHIDTPTNAESTLLSLTFARKLPAVGCCGDCYCGITESYTSDNLIDGKIYTNNVYVANSTVVYINGSRVTAGVEYTESSPDNRQLTILVPMTTITISYVYSVGNCTNSEEEPCVDTLDCMPDGFYSGLATVFSDRFDRPYSLETTGGCGGWISDFQTVDGIATYTVENLGNESGGAASLSSSIQASPGGFNRLVGSQWEVLALAQSGAGGIDISVTNGRGQSVGMSSNESLGITTFTMFANSYIYEDGDTSPLTFMNIDSYTVSPVGTFTFPEGVSYFHRLIQTLDGAEYRFWQEGLDESTATSFSISTQVNNPPTAGDITEPCPIQMQRVSFSGTLRAVKISASLNDGVYFDGDGAGGSNSWHGELCTVNPDGKIRFQHCATDTISVVAVGNTAPECGMSWSFSHFDAGTPGALLTYQEEIGTISTAAGQPGHLVISGFIRPELETPIFSLPIQIKSYDLGPFVGPNQPNFTQHGFTGGQVLYSTTVQTDGELYPFTIRIPANEYQVVRWGLSIVNPYAIPPTLPFKSGSVLFPNNHSVGVSLRNLKVYAESSAICTADDYCGDCLSARCSEVEDVFNGNDTGFSATNYPPYYRTPARGPDIEIDQQRRTSLTYAGGEISFTTQAPSDEYVILKYGSIFECASSLIDDNFNQIQREEGGGEVKFDFYTDSLSHAGDDFSSMGIYGWNDGPMFFLETGGGTMEWTSSDFDPSNLPSISAGTWYTMRIQNYFEGNQYLIKVKVWPAGSPEIGTWHYDGTYNDQSLFNRFSIELYNDTNVVATWKLRNLTITRLGFEGHPDTDGGGSTPIGGGGGPTNPPDNPPPEEPPPDDTGSGGSGGTGSGGTGSGGSGTPGAFLSYPASPKILLNGVSGTSGSPYIIENKSFDTLGADVEAIRLVNCSWVIIRRCDFRNVAQCITVLDSDNIFIEDCRYLNIIGPHERVGKNRANFVQMIRTTFGHIRRNKGKGGDTEDIISMFKSGGSSGNIFYIANNHFEGTNWDSTSGTAVLLGDYGGSYTHVQDNIFLNPGQVGIGVAGGVNNKVLRNIVYGEQRPYSNVGIYVSVFGSYTGPFGPHEVRDNRIYWKKADGTNNSTWYSKSSYGDTEPIGWDDNVRNDTTLSESALRVVL